MTKIYFRLHSLCQRDSNVHYVHFPTSHQAPCLCHSWVQSTFRTQYGCTQHINAKHTGIDVSPSAHQPELELSPQPGNGEGDAEQTFSPSFMDIDNEPGHAGGNEVPDPPVPRSTKHFHPHLTGSYCWHPNSFCNLCCLAGLPCDLNGTSFLRYTTVTACPT